MSAKTRPTSVTVVAVILLVLNGIALVFTPVSAALKPVRDAWAKAGMSVELAVGLTVVTCGVIVCAAIAMLMGKNWGRLLYLIGTPVMWIIGWLKMGFSPIAIPSIIIYIVFLVLLVQPPANRYFSGMDTQPPTAQPVPPAQDPYA